TASAPAHVPRQHLPNASGRVGRRTCEEIDTTATIRAQTPIATSSQIRGRPFPVPDARCGGTAVAVRVVETGLGGLDGGVGAVVVGVGAVVVGVGVLAVGVSGKLWVSVGGTCPFGVAPPVVDVEAVATATTTDTPMPRARAR